MLGAEARYFSVLKHIGSMQVIVPYSRTRVVARTTFYTRQALQSPKKQVQE